MCGEERKRHFKELALMIAEAWQGPNVQGRLTGLETQERVGSLLAEFILAQRRSAVVLLRSSTN